ncbi:hypothetical protein AB0I49_15855 [Streptomyces sp. NPDC050617]
MITKVVLPGLAEPSAQQAPTRGTATGTLSLTRPRVGGPQRFSG